MPKWYSNYFCAYWWKPTLQNSYETLLQIQRLPKYIDKDRLTGTIATRLYFLLYVLKVGLVQDFYKMEIILFFYMKDGLKRIYSKASTCAMSVTLYESSVCQSANVVVIWKNCFIAATSKNAIVRQRWNFIAAWWTLFVSKMMIVRLFLAGLLNPAWVRYNQNIYTKGTKKTFYKDDMAANKAIQNFYFKGIGWSEIDSH